VSSESYFEVELVNRLQSVVEKQRGQIKKLDQSIIEYKSDNEEVQLLSHYVKTMFCHHHLFPFSFLLQLRKQNDKFISCTKDLRRKLRTTQSQLHLLVDERAELTAKVYKHNCSILIFWPFPCQ
jgi:hypothetical protein